MVRTIVKHRKVTNGEVTLAVSETGQGQTLLFLNGLGATQVSWKRIMTLPRFRRVPIAWTKPRGKRLYIT